MFNRQAEGRDERVVWISDERCFGTIVGMMGAYYTTVSFIKNGHEREELMETSGIQLLEELIEHDDADE